MTIRRNATGILTIFSILVLVFTAKSQTSIYTIEKGTRIRVRLDSEINSKVSSVNDTFLTAISAPVKIRGVEVLPVETIIEGRIVRVSSAGIGNKPGMLRVKFETIYLADGVKREIDADLIEVQNDSGLIQADGDKSSGLLGSFFQKTKGVLYGLGTLLPFKGKEARIETGEEVTIILNKPVNLPPQDF